MKDLAQYHRLEATEPVPKVLADATDIEALLVLQTQSNALSTASLSPPGERDANVDLFAQLLCSAYTQATPIVRAHARALITAELSWSLLEFSKRCAALALRSGNPEVLHCGIAAQSLAGLRHGDTRDTIMALGELSKACAQLGLHPDAFRHGATLAGQAMATLLLDFVEENAAESRKR